ncbi:MAG: DNA mismatch repair endonuclease MutL [Acidobacteria bacterium]|nr:DNA mismatch repair endonuclease MutL [Acidobacteriota bacterium]
MAKIRVLPDTLANKIAAGEIIERPASVVKELLENALDARSRTLTVEVAGGGKQLIRVQDDGEGMSRDDAILAFEHHATSKIASAEDLMSITTLGFRGEALPSMASVARLTLRTSVMAAAMESSSGPGVGTEIEIHGGVIKSVKDAAWNQGTEVTLRDLFFNMPARRKFLKANITELTHITRLVTQYALAHPDKAFSLIHQSKSMLNCTPVLSLSDRIYQIFGEAFLKSLIAVEGQAESVRVYGYTSLPHEQRSNTYSQYFFVNKRMVRDRLISHALNQAYRPVNPSGLYPVVVLFIDIPPSEIDVNVHPAKTEIRFRQSDHVHQMVVRAIESALTQHKVFPAFSRKTPSAYPAVNASAASSEASYTSAKSYLSSPLTPAPAAHTPLWPVGRGAEPPNPAVDPLVVRETSPSSAPPASAGLEVSPCSPTKGGPNEPGPVESLSSYEIPLTLSDGGARPLAQLHESFILASDRGGMLIVDQHVAHERVLYEKTLAQMESAAVAVQPLLTPLTFDLTPSQKLTLVRLRPELSDQGFDVEDFGGATVAIKAVPLVAADTDVKRLLLEIMDTAENEAPTAGLRPIRERIAAGVACRAAIKVNMPLTLEKMQWLLDALWQTRVPTHCPHGRPIILRLSMRDIEKNFHRI